VNGGSEIVVEAWQSEFKRARGATGLRLGFEDVNVNAALREGDGSGEAVGSSADDAGPALRRFRIHDGPVRTDWDAPACVGRPKRAPTTAKLRRCANGKSLVAAVIVVEEAPVAIRWR